MLVSAAADRDAALRLLTVATSTADGPDVRTMVLRRVDRPGRTIGFYTDRRAAKVAAIITDPRVAVAGYDPVERVQLRLFGHAAIASEGADVDRAWSAVGTAGREAYRTRDVPGSPIASPADGLPAAERPGRADFAVVTLRLERIEWLDLGATGHRRADWYRSTEGWRGTWRTP